MFRKLLNIAQGRSGWLYVMYTMKLLYRAKIGITRTRTVPERKDDIEDSLAWVYQRTIKLKIAASYPMLTNERWEIFLKRHLRKIKYDGLDSRVSGHTEWYWFLNPISGLILASIGYCLGILVVERSFLNVVVWFFLFLFYPVPLDFKIIVSVFAMIEYVIIGVGLAVIVAFLYLLFGGIVLL